MQWVVVLVIFIAIFVNLRTFTLLFGNFSETVDIKNAKLMIVAALLLDVCGFISSRQVIFVLFTAALCTVIAFLEVKTRRRTRIKFDEIAFIDSLVMQMRCGTSFENALLSVISTAKPDSTYGQHAKFDQILKKCEQNASQSFRILTSYRHFLRIRDHLHRKHANVSMQARAQALVCGVLFLFIFAAEWAMFPDFAHFLSTTWGRVTLVFAIVVLAVGEKAILALAKPGEVEL